LPCDCAAKGGWRGLTQSGVDADDEKVAGADDRSKSIQEVSFSDAGDAMEMQDETFVA